MSKNKNKSGYVFTAQKGKKINKSQAAGSTVDKPKKHLNVFGGEKKERLRPFGVDSALNHSIHADRRFIKRWGRKVMNAQKREDFIDNLPKTGSGIKNGIGGLFSRASAAISDANSERKAKRELEQTAYREARKSARYTWNKFIKPRNNGERAVQFDD